jgi:hypothetical protein
MRLWCIAALVLAGCAARSKEVSVPGLGCVYSKVTVPSGCYSQKSIDSLEVRCKDSTTLYKCIKTR